MAGGPVEPPPGIDPTESRTTLIYGVVSAMLGVAFLSLCLRLYTRVVLIKQFGWDDGAAIFAFGMVFGSAFAVMYQTTFGFATHVYFLDPVDIMLYLRTFYVSIVFYNAALFGIKMTFLLQYWRIIAIQRMKKVFYVAMFIVLGASLSQVPVQIFTCTPIAGFWDKSITDARCIDNQVQWFSNAGINILTDVIVFVLPLPVIGKLNLARGQKYSLLGIFCLGFFTCALSVARIRFLKLTEDFTWTNVEAAVWSIAELSSGVLCSSLLTLRPLAVRVFPSMRSAAAKSTNQYYRQPNSHVASPHDVELSHTWRNLASESKDRIVCEDPRPGGQDSDSENPTPWSPTSPPPPVRARRT
ncbi:hypothetical protein NLU13_7615 [Sarocladium strictum]|uniref:Rhodopsin domain-containing protein n=1 Tax=Sarocladium strictum TaxID=5046 RepID=A0AA39GFH5_SARSR|nr:hypothetical protein NLU13_7615 [Sarocladium strictum]